MSRKVIHEHKIPKSLTLVLYAIAIALTLNLAKPFVNVSNAQGSDLSSIWSNVIMTNTILLRLEDKIDDVEDDTSSVRSAVMGLVGDVGRMKNKVDDLYNR